MYTMKRHPSIFYALIVLGFVLSAAMAYVFMNAYVAWTVVTVMVSLSILAAVNVGAAVLYGIIKERGSLIIAIESVLVAALPFGIMLLSDKVFKDWLNLGNVVAGYISLFLILIVQVTFIVLLVTEGKRIFVAPKLSVITAAVLSIAFVTTFALPVLSEEIGSIETYHFTSEPVVYVSSNGNYRVVFSTNVMGTAELKVTDKDGVSHVYYDQVNGVQRFHSIFHKIDVPASVLDGGSYSVVSRKTESAKNYGIPLGKTIESKTYGFHGYEGDGDVSFICVSDIQGPYKQAQYAVSKAAAAYDYDFVLMLGDASSAYNTYEDDFVQANLVVAAKASRSEIPVYYVIGNHENKGIYAKELNELIPTPSETGDLYYTFTVGDAHFTALNFGDDHNDDMARYNGVNHFNEYKDKEYDWLKNTVIAGGEYKNYRYNLVVSHIPAINDNELRMDEYICGECNEKHDYKWTDFINAYEEMGIQYVVSGHTHSVPREVTDETCSFINLQTGAKYNDGQSYRNSIVFLKDGAYSYVEYNSEG